MFDAGLQELLLIMVIALLVVGPNRLPGLARKAGMWVGKARHYVAGVRQDIEKELQADELRDMMQKQEQEMQELRGLLNKTRAETEGSLEMVSDYLVNSIDEQKEKEQESSEQPPQLDDQSQDNERKDPT
jgi:sec-independent protein translocase protein TatB